jgi:hypothetical protein
MGRQPTYKELIYLINKPYSGSWHSVSDGVYQRHDTFEEAKEYADKYNAKVIRGDLHDLMIGIKN